jgi:hypothetical protein
VRARGLAVFVAGLVGRLGCVLAAGGIVGCALSEQMLASSGDLSDYGAFRRAGSQGIRLERAHAYLARHPAGRWADEVHRAFDAEEQAWFEAAKASRERARDYLVYLPRGPHADAARELIVLFDERETDIDMLELLAATRQTGATLDLQADQRRRVGEVVLEDLAALLDPATRGADPGDPPDGLARLLNGPARQTWGKGPRGLRDDEVFFGIPTPEEPERRVAEIRFRLKLSRGRIVGGEIQGEDLFVRWAEADTLRVLDPSVGEDRLVAVEHLRDVLGGALEARLPAARCAAGPVAGEIIGRACDGLHVSARMGAGAGKADVIGVGF